MSDMRETPKLPPPPKWGLISGAVMAVGLLILVPSGLCTGLFGLGALSNLFSGHVQEALSALTMVAMTGGIPIVIGAVLVVVALKLRR